MGNFLMPLFIFFCLNKTMGKKLIRLFENSGKSVSVQVNCQCVIWNYFSISSVVEQ